MPGPISGILSNGKIDLASLSFPLHPIFNWTDVEDLTYLLQPDMSAPDVAAGATLLAKDVDGRNAIAINAAENVIGLNMYGGWWFNDLFPQGSQMLANCLLYVGRGM